MVTNAVAGTVIPNMSDAVWTRLRAQFAKSLPSSVTPTYLASVLGQKENSAQIVLRSLRLLGLVDEQGRPTDLASEWRDDESYAAACAVMLRNVYPNELLDVAPPPNPDRDVVRKWFMRTRKVGEGAAANMAATYLLIARGKPSKDKPARVHAGTATAERARVATRASAGKATPARARESRSASPTTSRAAVASPTPQIAVQVNIDPAATPEQIEAIFASMAKHLYQLAD